MDNNVVVDIKSNQIDTEENIKNCNTVDNINKSNNNANHTDDNYYNKNEQNKNKKNIRFKGEKGGKTRKRIFAKRKNKTFKSLLKQSNAIKREYKPGKFEEVINGPRGPDVRLHRHNIIVGLLKLLLLLFITAGIVLLSVIMLCITINVGYVCVQIDDVNPFVQILFFAFYFDALYYITRSLWRTYLRSIHTIINAQFGSSINDIFVKRVLGYFLSLKIAEWTMPESYRQNPKNWYEKVNLTIFIIFLFLCFLPILVIAYIYGYWKLTETICLLFVGGGAVTIIILNLFSRLILFAKFFRRLDEFFYDAPFFVDLNERIDNQTSYLRLTYCTTNGLEGGEKPFNYVLDLLIHIIISTGLAAFVFGSFDPEAWKITIIVVALVIVLPIRFRKNIRSLLVKCHILSKEKLEQKNEKLKNKVNAEMDATHKIYIDRKKCNLKELNTNNKVSGIVSLTSRPNFYNNNNDNNNNNGSKTNKGYQPINNYNMNELTNDIKNMDNIIEIKIKNDNSSSIKMNQQGVSSSSNIANSNSNINNQNQNIAFGNSATPIQQNSIKSLNSVNNPNSYKNESNSKLEEDTFKYILNSDKPYIRRKALLTWDINNLISWRGCITIFISRCVKYIAGITFMAFLNYYRYSKGADNKTTTRYLIKDIVTHAIFVILILCQDILYLIPLSSSLSMKTRKFLFLILIITEFAFVILMRVIIVDGYIPMAFIVLAYANFLVYPDPRYTWDEENATRKTFFDLFKPDLNLRSDIDYEHYNKKKGIFRKSSSSVSNKIRRLSNSVSNSLSHLTKNISTNSTSQVADTQPLNDHYLNDENGDSNNAKPNDDNNNISDNNSRSSDTVNIVDTTFIASGTNEEIKDKNKVNDKYKEYGVNIPVYRDPSSFMLTGLNDEILCYDPVSSSIAEKDSKNIFIDIGGQNYKISPKKVDPKLELNKVINNVKSEMQYNRNTRARYNSIAILLVIACFIFISVVIGILFAGTAKEDITSDRSSGTLHSPKPAICQWRGDNISINEFATLACACYYKTTDDIKYSWLYGRPSTSSNNFTIGENSISNSSGVQYVDFVNNETNTIVVAVRGTSTMEDIFQDIYIWSASALLQLSGLFGTFIKFWPRETIAELVKFIVKQFTNLQLLYWVDVEKHIIRLREEHPTSNIYLTGHSLGGGVAGVISAHLNIPAITFSSPGLGYSYKTYDIELKKLINNFVNVVPMSDPVPLLDSQVGQIQNIECNTEEPLSCHSIYNTIDTLNKMCYESSVYRYWDKTIDPKINGKDIPHVMPY